MPWTMASFRKKHNHSLSDRQAGKAAAMATAMVKAGVPEGEAIATANKHAKKMGSMAKQARRKKR